MISKGEWGVGYLAGTGSSLIVVLTWWFAIGQAPDFTAFVGTITGIILSVALVYLAYWLTQSELQDEHIWVVSLWGATGLAIPTLPTVAIVLLGLDAALHVEASVLVNIAAASAVIGALFGAVTELEVEHLRALGLNRRNTILNRVLRHDVRNDAGLLLVFAERLEDEFDTAADELAEPIREKTEEIIELSKTAKRIEELDHDAERRPVDIVDVVETQVQTVRSTRPRVDIETDLPDEAWVRADDLLGTVVDNIVENAVQHNDRHPKLHISVRNPPSSTGDVELRVADNGPGMPTETARTLSREGVSDPDDGTSGIGLGLWLVKWFVDTYDGHISVEENDPRGTVFRISLPSCRPGRIE